jgi:hypothetical protein
MLLLIVLSLLLPTMPLGAWTIVEFQNEYMTNGYFNVYNFVNDTQNPHPLYADGTVPFDSQGYQDLTIYRIDTKSSLSTSSSSGPNAYHEYWGSYMSGLSISLNESVCQSCASSMSSGSSNNNGNSSSEYSAPFFTTSFIPGTATRAPIFTQSSQEWVNIPISQAVTSLDFQVTGSFFCEYYQDAYTYNAAVPFSYSTADYDSNCYGSYLNIYALPEFGPQFFLGVAISNPYYLSNPTANPAYADIVYLLVLNNNPPQGGTPEPSTYMLMGTFLSLIALARWRSKQHQK